MQLKLALGADGAVPRGAEGSRSGSRAKRRARTGHLLRAAPMPFWSDARTVADDDPELTCRLPGLARSLAGARRALRAIWLPPLESKLVRTRTRASGAGVFCGRD